MDDRTFDEATAREWIDTIEASERSPRDHDIYPRLNAWLRSAQPAAVLDIGAGQGICSEKIELEPCAYTGLEPSLHLVERATQRYARHDRQFVQGSAYAMPFDDATFDAAFSVAVWHLLSDLRAAAREVRRVLRPAGAFLIVTANPHDYSPWLERYTERSLDGHRFEGRNPGQAGADVLFLHTFQDIEASLNAAGLAVRSAETFRTDKNRDCFIAIEGQLTAP
jgi:SAM-dependent methyltransferase